MVNHSKRESFKRLFDWEFNPIRSKITSRARKSKNFNNISKIIEDELLNFELELDYDEELINAYFPLIEEDVSNASRILFRVIIETVELVSNGMGLSFRNSKEETLKLFERFGYNSEIVEPFVSEYENRVMTRALKD